jgi:hypothetical protein
MKESGGAGLPVCRLPPPHSRLGMGCHASLRFGLGSIVPGARAPNGCHPWFAQSTSSGGPYLSAPASVPAAGGHRLPIPAPPALEPHMGIFPLRPLERTVRHRVHIRVHTSSAHSTRPPPRFHLSASTSLHFMIASHPPLRDPCLLLFYLVVLLVDTLLHRFLALDFTILKAWDYWEAPRGSLRYSWGCRCWGVVVGSWKCPRQGNDYG